MEKKTSEVVDELYEVGDAKIHAAMARILELIRELDKEK